MGHLSIMKDEIGGLGRSLIQIIWENYNKIHSKSDWAAFKIEMRNDSV